MAGVSFPHFSDSNSLSIPSPVVSPDSPAPTSINLSLFDSDYDLDLEIDPNANGGDHDDYQVSFVTNLFFRPSEEDSDSELPSHDSSGSDGTGEFVEPHLQLRLASGFGFNAGSSSRSTGEAPGFNDLRVLSFESDFDSDDGLQPLYESDDENDGLRLVSDFDRPPFCWDYLGFNTQMNNIDSLGFEERACRWQNQESDIELSSIVTGEDDDYGVDLVFSQCCDGYIDDDDDDDDFDNPIQMDTGARVIEVEEISNLFDMYNEREEQEMMTESEYDVLEAIGNLEWEIMLALDNFRREMQGMDLNGEAFGLEFNDNAYEDIIREMEERMNEWRGSPPTAKSVIENLPTVCLEGKEACAICKDDISGEETLRQLPCLHYYHGDCIVPWLKMHNTCPLCRHELPTDDPDFDSINRDREGFTINANVSVAMRPGYGFDTFL